MVGAQTDIEATKFELCESAEKIHGSKTSANRCVLPSSTISIAETLVLVFWARLILYHPSQGPNGNDGESNFLFQGF